MGGHVPLRLRAHSAATGAARPWAEYQLHHLRLGRFAPPARHDRQGLQPGFEEVHATDLGQRDLELEERAGWPERGADECGAHPQPVRDHRGQGLRGVPAPLAPVERARFRRPHRGGREDFPGAPAGDGLLPSPLPPRVGGRVPRHQPRPVRAHPYPRRGRPGRAGARRGGRFGSVDLRVPRRDHPQYRGVRAGLPECQHHHARAELPLHPEHPGRRERRHCAERGAPPEEVVDRSGIRRKDRRVRRRQRAR